MFSREFSMWPAGLVAWSSLLPLMGGCRYMREFGFIIPERSVVVDDVSVRGTGRSGLQLEETSKIQSGPPHVEKVGGLAVLVHLHPRDLREQGLMGRSSYVERPQEKCSGSPAHSTPSAGDPVLL